MSSNTAVVRILDQTGPIRFLGCSVISFTSNAGWGQDNSTLTVDLVEDCSINDRFWGRDTEIIGTAKYFDLTSVGSPFVFGGIVVSWTENKSMSGQTFTVTLNDTKQLLSGVTVLTDSYAWMPISYSNFYNVFAKYEASVLYNNCPAFGTARSDQRGMNFNNILAALCVIGGEDQGDPLQRPACFSPTRGNVIPGTADFVIDMGLLYNKATGVFSFTRPDHVPLAPDYYKIAESENLLDLFVNVCEVTARNLFVETFWDPITMKNVIKIRCIHLVDVFQGKYDTLVGTFDGVSTSLSYGKEFNNPKTRNMIIGDNVSYVSQATEFLPCFGLYTKQAVVNGFVIENRQPMIPRLTPTRNWARPDGTPETKCGFWVPIDILKLQTALFNPLRYGVGSSIAHKEWFDYTRPDGTPDKKLVTTKRIPVPAQGNPIEWLWISEADLQAALASESMWRMRATAGTIAADGTLQPDPETSPVGSLSYHLQMNYPEMITMAAESLQKLFRLKQVADLKIPISDIAGSVKGGAEQSHKNQQRIADIASIYNFVLDLANNYYGKSYVFKVNETICAHWADVATNAGELVFSAQPTNEGGWIEPGKTALGLADPDLVFFRTDDGRVGSFARFSPGPYNGTTDVVQSAPTAPGYNGILDISVMDGTEFISNGTDIWLRGEVDESIYWVGSETYGIINFNSPSFLKPNPRQNNALAEQALAMLFMLFKATQPELDPADTEKIFKCIVGATINNPGSGYKTGDKVTWNGGAEASVVSVSPTGGITGLAITNGGQDVSDLQGSVSGSGSGAVVTGRILDLNQEKWCGLPSALWNTNGNYPGLSNVAFLDINMKGQISKAVPPNSAAIPMKSNMWVYGPFFSNNFFTDYGGVNVEKDNDLNPWTFGNMAVMITAGDARAQTAFSNNEQPLVISENGNATMPGMPKWSLAAQVTMTGETAGPLVNNVSVTFGSAGITTSYDFKTFSRKFGNLTAIQTDQVKQVSLNRQKNIKKIREGAYARSRALSKGSKSYSQAKAANRQYQSLARQNTTHRMLVAENYKWELLNSGLPTSGWGERTVVAMEGLDKVEFECANEYTSKAMISFDGLYSPVSISGDGKLPRFAVLKSGTITPEQSGHRKYTINPVPPAYHAVQTPTGAKNVGLNAIDLRRDYFNPFTNPFPKNKLNGDPGHPYHSGQGAGHIIDIAARETGVLESGLMSTLYDTNQPGRYSKDYRFVSHRGPMVLHQWGYDTQGKPVPNLADTVSNAQSGIYATGQLTERFLPDWLQKPSTWPVAPVDLRFDRTRGMWVAPPEYKMVVVEPLESIDPFSTGLGKLVNSDNNRKYSPPIVDASGNEVAQSELRITIEDRLGTSASAGQRAYAYFDTFTSTYLMMGGGGGGITIGKFCNQWPSLMNVKDPKNCVKEVVLYAPGTGCYDPNDSEATFCPWNLEPVMVLVDGVKKPKTVQAINLFSNVAAHEYQTKWCALANNGGTYVLIAAEC